MDRMMNQKVNGKRLRPCIYRRYFHTRQPSFGTTCFLITFTLSFYLLPVITEWTGPGLNNGSGERHKEDYTGFFGSSVNVGFSPSARSFGWWDKGTFCLETTTVPAGHNQG